MLCNYEFGMAFSLTVGGGTPHTGEKPSKLHTYLEKQLDGKRK